MPALEKALRDLPARDNLTADVEIYLKAVQFILRHPEEFAAKEYVAQTLAALDKGMQRAAELRARKALLGEPEGARGAGLPVAGGRRRAALRTSNPRFLRRDQAG